MQTSHNDELRSMIRAIPDFPKPGIMFRDITTLINHPRGLKTTIAALFDHYNSHVVDKIVAIESRGFIFAAGLAERLGCGMVLARKPGKLPAATVKETYALEYGQDTIEIHADAISPGDRCVVIDDLIATGGTAAAACRIIEKMQGVVVGCGFVIALPELGGLEKLRAYDPYYLVEF